ARLSPEVETARGAGAPPEEKDDEADADPGPRPPAIPEGDAALDPERGQAILVGLARGGKCCLVAGAEGGGVVAAMRAARAGTARRGGQADRALHEAFSPHSVQNFTAPSIWCPHARQVRRATRLWPHSAQNLPPLTLALQLGQATGPVAATLPS